MKILLKESAAVFNKYRKQFENNIIPVLEDLGFIFNLDRSLDINKFETRYKGTYEDHNDNKAPFTLAVNTTHRGLDTEEGEVFVTLNLDGKLTPIGAISLSNPEEAQNMFDYSLPNREIKTFKTTPAEDKIDSHNGKESKTAKEWKKELQTKLKSMDPKDFGTWYNNVYPIELQ